MSNFINHNYYLIWLQISVLVLIISLPSLSSTTNNDDNDDVNYLTYCDSIIPQSTTQEQVVDDVFHTSTFVSGGAPFLNQSLSEATLFRQFRAYKTSTNGVFEVEVILTVLQKLNAELYYAYGNYSSDYESNGVLRFRLSGYFYEESRNICMVGFGSGYATNGSLIDDIPAVFKANNVRTNSSIVTSLITATLESLSSVSDSSYFQPISLLMFNEMRYEYSLVSKHIGSGGFDGNNDVSKSLPLPLGPADTFCSIFHSFRHFELVYPSTCDSAKNCSPFGTSTSGYLPLGISFSSIQCDNEDHKFRVLIKVSEGSYNDEYYYTSFDPKTALIGEGIWDGKKNKLQIVACKILNVTRSSKNVHVEEDCSIRLTLRYPRTSSIRDDSYIRGEIRSSKPTNDSEYFDTILFKVSQSQFGVGVKGLEYEYTQIDKVRKLCTSAKKRNVKHKDRYFNGSSYGMSFDVLVKSADGNSSLGYITLVYVGDRVYDQKDEFAMYVTTSSSDKPKPYGVMVTNSNLQVPMNISYKISFSELSNVWFDAIDSSSLYQPNYIEISAEGIYDPTTDSLCMIGCKKVGSKCPTIENSLDREIVTKVQFPSLNTKNNGGGYIKGSIESLTKTHDSLYFERLVLTSSNDIVSVASEIIWSMEFEIILILILDTLACVFITFLFFVVN